MLLGISGFAGAGKDQMAEYLVGDFNFVRIALADPLKRIARDVYAFTDEQLWGPSHCRNAEDPRFPREDGTCLSPREFLQKLGTEVGRTCYPNTWIDLCLRDAKRLIEDNDEGDLTYTPKDGVRGKKMLEYQADYYTHTRKIRGVAIPDIRFRNEIAAVRAQGGKVVRIVRPGAGLKGSAAAHLSESEQAGVPDSAFDYVLQNTGSLEDLRSEVRKFVNQL